MSLAITPTPTTTITPSRGRWTRRWIPEPRLGRTYLVLAVPGGAAAEQVIGAPAGVSHLLEHLLYRQNNLHGYALDNFGGNFGLWTGRETLFAVLIFDPADAPQAAALVETWWHNMTITPELLQEESAVVSDEITQARQEAVRKLRQQLVQLLLPDCHLSRDFAGNPEALASLTVPEVVAYQHQLRDLGGAIIAIGPVNPWSNNHLDSSGSEGWLPPRVAINPASRRGARLRAQHPQTIITAGRVVAGLTSPAALGSYAAYASLAFGRVHPSQRRFHIELGLRHFNVDLRMHAEVGILSATAICSHAQRATVAALVEDLLEDVTRGSTSERLKRCALHYLTVTRDQVENWVVEEATRALHNAPAFTTLLAEAQALPPDAYPARIAESFIGPVSRVTLTDS